MREAPLTLDHYDYELPGELIAQEPLASRNDARLLHWRSDGRLVDRRVPDLLELVEPGDLMVLNDTRVYPARLFGRKRGGSAEVELLLIAPLNEDGAWEAMLRPGRRLPPGSEIELDGGAVVTVGETRAIGLRRVEFPPGLGVVEYAHRFGHVPLPPYIKRPDARLDHERYQTVFARHDGSVAAPTAGLHLDSGVLAGLDRRQVERAFVTLHVGPGTFRPVDEEDLARGELHREHYSVPASTLASLARTRERGGRVIAVGTTVCRTLESIDAESGSEQHGETTLFIRPGHSFSAVDVLLTNFHLPRSSLLLLVAAFAGEGWRSAYAHAIESGYRFFSYGDANWIEPGFSSGEGAG